MQKLSVTELGFYRMMLRIPMSEYVIKKKNNQTKIIKNYNKKHTIDISSTYEEIELGEFDTPRIKLEQQRETQRLCCWMTTNLSR